MTIEAAALQAGAHPAPHRAVVGVLALAFGVAGGPLAWGVHLVVNYGIASHACFPGAVAAQPAAARRQAVCGGSCSASISIAIAVAAAAALVSYRSWRATRREFAGRAGDLIEIGEGRTRFLALWGLLTGVGFLLAVVFDGVALWVVPLCA